MLVDCLMDSGGKMEDGKKNKAKTSATSQNWWFSIAYFSCGWRGKVLFYFLFFSRRETLELYLLLWFFLFVCEGCGKVVLLMNWTSFFGPQSYTDNCRHPVLFLHPTTGCGDVCANGGTQGLQYPSFSWYNGTWTFSLYCSLSDLFGAHGCRLHGYPHLSHTLSVILPKQPTTTRINRFHWLNRTTSIEYVCVRECVYACVHAANRYWRTLKQST